MPNRVVFRHTRTNNLSMEVNISSGSIHFLRTHQHFVVKKNEKKDALIVMKNKIK